MMRARDVRLHAEALALAACIRVGLRLLPFARVAALAAALPPRRDERGGVQGSPPSTNDTVAACVAAAQRAASRVARPTCLFQSLIALAMLRRRGHEATLHVGARRTASFEAHAWLTVDGVPVDGTADAGYVPLWRFPLGAAS